MSLPALSPGLRHRLAILGGLSIILAAITPKPASTQQPTGTAADPSLAAATAGLGECTGLIERGQTADALAPGKRAEAQFRAALARNASEPEAMVGLARVLSLCLIPSADFAGQGELSGEAIELLQN